MMQCPTLLPGFLLLLSLLVAARAETLSCSDDRDGLLEAISDPSSLMFQMGGRDAISAVEQFGCSAVKNIPGLGNGCEHFLMKSLSEEHCPQTCEVSRCIPACPQPNITSKQSVSTLPKCWNATDPSNASSCFCEDDPSFVDPYMSGDCESVYSAYFVANAPMCLVDKSGYVSETNMKSFRKACPRSCKICKYTGEPPSQRKGQPRGIFYSKCSSLPYDVRAPGQNVELKSGACTLCANVTIHSGGSLTVAGPMTNSPAIISGGDSSRHFLVFGELTLEDVTLQYGYTGYDGGAILIDSRNGNTASATLIRTAIIDCESYGNGGGLAVIGDRSTLILVGSNRMEDNVAKKGGGGAIFLSEGADMILEGQTASSTDVSIKGMRNSAKLGGGFVYMESQGTLFRASGAGVSIHLEECKAESGVGGAVALHSGSALTIESGADLTATYCESFSQGGAISMEGAGTTFILSDTGSTLSVKNNKVSKGFTCTAHGSCFISVVVFTCSVETVTL